MNVSRLGLVVRRLAGKPKDAWIQHSMITAVAAKDEINVVAA